ncbi:hypothetical protein HNP46_004189 [Pseudomonas nitritireducens]|uniref:Uncharacterized protein n=1 Tax=Pseudomonas nitroreducens TaxID=46680 RepID=A0A7W7KNE8_PSENT|nr:hypothetical protein [Pseudomonas nitritireducens]MBB4865308.1 hypothetical protein [Pseudomonas nitritireducens]
MSTLVDDTTPHPPALHSCSYQRGTYECRGDGYLWDADTDGFDPEEKDDPCPCCNTLEYLRQAKDEAETTSEWWGSHGHWTGEDLWLRACEIAREANPEQAIEALRAVGEVQALVPDENGPDGVSIRIHNKG